MSNSKNTNALPPIAIVGMAGRFPGAQNLDEFWRILSEGVETISTLTDAELEFTDADPALLHDPLYVKRKAILEGVDLFDAAFFGYTPREAELSDPQQRFFLQCAYEALETAGYDPDRFPGLIGVFGGSGFSHYLFANLLSNRELLESVGFFETSIRNCSDHLATTVAYKLNLKGPAVTVQTACSTSLVAVHVACQSLINFECDMALAGGVSIALPQKSGYLYQEGGILSPDGHCRAFDAEAQGTVTGNGAAVIVLKRLEDALQDRDNIEAVILGSAIGNDGSLKAGYAAPGIDGQAQVIAEAQSVAGVDPDTITYIEAHGTGTKLGDPIEIAALNQVFRQTTNRKSFCAIGSLKTNIGHLDAASGVAGLIKVVLSLRHKMLPPCLHFERPNPEINFSDSPFFVNTQLRPWNVEGPRRAGVSSFGIGGTNAHAILEEPPALASGKETRACLLLVFSAKTLAALDSATHNLAAFLERHRLEVNLADVAYTLQTGRREYKYRRAIVCRNHDNVLAALKAHDSSRTVNGSYEGKVHSIVFMFPGQGAQYINMGQGLYESEPLFRSELERCAKLARPHLGFDLLDVLYPKHSEEGSSRLTQTQVAQPALFAIEYSLARLWMQWGIRPTAMIGHSVGEYVAACLAGVLSLEDALRLVIVRGRLMQSLPAGTMLAVQQPLEELSRRLIRGVDLAAINGPDACVVSGPADLVEQFESQLSAAGIACRRLATSHAFHSAMMEPILGSFHDVCNQISFHSPELPFISNLSGTWITADEATSPDYWTRHLREAVRFGDGLSELLQDPESILLEVGPGRTLAALARKNPHRTGRHLILNSLRHAEDPTLDDVFFLNTLGKLWVAGAQVDWSGFYQHEQRKRISLPVYPFEPQRYWIEPKKQTEPRPEPPTKKAKISEWFYTPSWKSLPLAQKSFSLPQRSWLVFVDPYGCGFKLVEELQRRGAQVFTVEQGSEYLRRDHAFTVRPEIGQDYELMLKSLHEKGQFPGKIVHFWNLAQPTDNHFSSQPDIDLSFWSPLLLARAIGTLDSSASTELLMISNSLYNVIGDKTFLPERATLLGPCRVIPQEYANISCRHIDLDILSGEETQPVFWSNLVAEFVCATQEKVVAYRRGNRWVQAFESLSLVPPPSKLPIVRDKGTYLITGGLGGIGLTLADELARSAKARLILIGRSTFPPRESWTSWLDSHDGEDATGIKIRKLMSWEKIGAEVLVMTADVSSQIELGAAISIAKQRFGEIHGVLHCAGIPGGGVIQLKSREAAHAVLAPKVQGTMLLAAALQSTPLDFFIACSSQASILGGFGQVDYCAAAAFLDVFAHHCRSNHSVPMMSVNWDAWQDVGMLARKAGEWGVGTEEAITKETSRPLPGQREVESSQRETSSSTFRSNAKEVFGNGHQHCEDYPSVAEGVVASVYAASLQRGITPREGQDAFRHILSAAELPQLIVSTTNLQAAITEAGNSAALKWMVEKTSDTLLHTLHPRPAMQTPYVGPRDESEMRIVESWQKVLGVAEIGIHDNYFDLGGDSVQAIQIVAQMNRKGFHLTPQQLFQFQTIAELAKVATGSQPTPPNVPEVALETNSSEFPLAGLNEEELKELEKFLEETDEKQLG